MIALGNIEQDAAPRTAFEFVVPIRLGTGLNSREHFMARKRRVKKEHEAVQLLWLSLRPPKLHPPFVVTIETISPVHRDSDQCVGGAKGVRDAIARLLGIDDRDDLSYAWLYPWRRGPWAVRIHVEGRRAP
jgi:hypothetical protein